MIKLWQSIWGLALLLSSGVVYFVREVVQSFRPITENFRRMTGTGRASDRNFNELFKAITRTVDSFQQRRTGCKVNINISYQEAGSSQSRSVICCPRCGSKNRFSGAVKGYRCGSCKLPLDNPSN